MEFVSRLFAVAGKSVLVTGGRRGVGLAIAEGFVKAGARVYVSSRDAAGCGEVAAELGQLGACVAVPGDVSTTEGRRSLLAQVKARESSLDVLVNNAGANLAAPLASYPEGGWDEIFGLNLKAAFFLIQEFLPLLEAAARPDDPARIINIGSVNALRLPLRETYAYTSSKAALHHLTRHLAGRLAARHITANVVAPGLFRTMMGGTVIDAERQAELIESIPLKRRAEPEDVAAAAIYLASRAGAFLTGAVLPVDGGLATTI